LNRQIIHYRERVRMALAEYVTLHLQNLRQQRFGVRVIASACAREQRELTHCTQSIRMAVPSKVAQCLDHIWIGYRKPKAPWCAD
jgi:hypothetical protein